MGAGIQFSISPKDINYQFDEIEQVKDSRVKFLTERGNVRISLELDLSEYLDNVMQLDDFIKLDDLERDSSVTDEQLEELNLTRDDLHNYRQASGDYVTYIIKMGEELLKSPDDFLDDDLEAFVEIY